MYLMFFFVCLLYFLWQGNLCYKIIFISKTIHLGVSWWLKNTVLIYWTTTSIKSSGISQLTADKSELLRMAWKNLYNLSPDCFFRIPSPALLYLDLDLVLSNGLPTSLPGPQAVSPAFSLLHKLDHSESSSDSGYFLEVPLLALRSRDHSCLGHLLLNPLFGHNHLL